MQHSSFSHVDVVLPDGNLLGASDNPNAPVVEGNANGVAIRPPNYQLFRTRRIAEIDATLATEMAFYAWLREQLGKPFDHDALTAMMNEANLDDLRNWRDPDLWFCSEMLVCGMENKRVIKWPLVVSKNRVSPSDLLLISSPIMLNAATFNDPIEGLRLCPGEV